MLTFPELDLKDEYTQDFLRSYMPSYLSIKTSRCMKMRTTNESDIQYYCCSKCKDSLKIVFKPEGQKYILKDYVVEKSECVLVKEDKILNYYLNLIEIYYPIIRDFISEYNLQSVSANKILKIYSQKKLHSKRTFIDIIDDLSSQNKNKISKKWSNMITKYRRESNLKVGDESKSLQSHAHNESYQYKILKPIQNLKKSPQSFVQPISEKLAKHRYSIESLDPTPIIIPSICQSKQDFQEHISEDGDIQINFNAFTSNWDEPQKDLKIRNFNIDQSLPKHFPQKNSSLSIPDMQNPSYESVVSYSYKNNCQN